MSEQAATNPSEQPNQLPEEYELSVSDPEKTGVRLFNLQSHTTGVTAVFVEFNKDYDVHAAIPWAGARTSRSDKPHEEIYEEIKDVSHADKIDMFFGYGHASIANMSPGMIHLNNLPMSEAYWIFNHLTLVGGQESSTRYIELSNPSVTALEDLVDLSALTEEERHTRIADWDAISEQAHRGFTKWQPVIEERLEDFVWQENPDMKAGAMSKRALDAARAWLPFGGRTSMSLQFDVREAISLITQLNERDDFYGRELADQLTKLYSLKEYEETSDIQADLAGLLKYTKGHDTIRPNLERALEILANIPAYQKLEEASHGRIDQAPEAHSSKVDFLPAHAFRNPGSEVIAGYISVLLPNLPAWEVADFVNELSDAYKEELLEAILHNHTQHNVLRNAADVRGHVIDCETALAYLRDFNRHRALGRLAVMFETGNSDAIVRSGFNRSHVLSQTDALRDLEEDWNQDFADLYQNIYTFYEQMKAHLGEDADYSFMYHVLPLGHQTRLLMSGPLMQWNYFSHLRIRPGGDYGYRELTHDIARAIADEPGLSSFGKELQAPDYNSRPELQDRS